MSAYPGLRVLDAVRAGQLAQIARLTQAGVEAALAEPDPRRRYVRVRIEQDSSDFLAHVELQQWLDTQAPALAGHGWPDDDAFLLELLGSEALPWPFNAG